VFTVILAFIEAKYKHGFELTFLGTVIIDIAFMNSIAKIWSA